jgi:hypothetical protein
VQAPGNPMNYNRYSYVMNNPLKYIDSSGYNYQPHKSDEEAYKYVSRDTGWGGGSSGFNSLWSNIPHIARNRFSGTDGWGYDQALGRWENVFTGETMGTTSYMYMVETGQLRSDDVKSIKGESIKEFSLFRKEEYREELYDDDYFLGIFISYSWELNMIADTNGGGWSPYNLSGEARLAMAKTPNWLGLPSFPDAMSIELNGSAGAVVATNTSPIGGLIKLNGNIEGTSAKGYLQGSAGLGTVFASADVVLTQYYIVGPNASKVRMSDFYGAFYSGNIGIDAGISLGAGVSWSSPFAGAHIIGISSSVGVGVSPTVVTGSAYWGQMDFYSNHMK